MCGAHVLHGNLCPPPASYLTLNKRNSTIRLRVAFTACAKRRATFKSLASVYLTFVFGGIRVIYWALFLTNFHATRAFVLVRLTFSTFTESKARRAIPTLGKFFGATTTDIPFSERSSQPRLANEPFILIRIAGGRLDIRCWRACASAHSNGRGRFWRFRCQRGASR